MTATEQETQRAEVPAPTQSLPRRALPVAYASLILVVGLAVLWVVLIAGGGAAPAAAGLPDAGAVTRWGLPVVRFLSDAAATGTVGLLLIGAFCIPGADSRITATGYRLTRWASSIAFVWVAAVAVEALLTLSDLLGQPLSAASPGRSLVSFVSDVSQGRALAVQGGLALVAAVLSRLVLSRNGATWAALVALAAVLPPTLTGHAAAAGNHQLAVISLVVHVGAAVCWIGGLIGVFAVRGTPVLAGAAARYSRLAGWCLVAVGLSGLANAWVRLGAVDRLWTTTYGLLVLGKLAALVLVGACGAVHRTRTLPALKAGAAGAFRRLALGEVTLFAATLGLAVGLSRTPTPVPRNPITADPTVDLVGFPMPPAFTPSRLFTESLLDPWFATIVVLGLGLYLAGVLRLRRGGHAWPWHRTVCWVAGMLLLAFVTCSGLARYGMLMFSAHMAQHMALSMPVPILLVLGAPMTLALRAVRASPDKSVRGPREWMLLILHSRVVRVLSHPLVALALFVGSLYGLYFSDLFETAMRTHLGHLLMLNHFLLVGYLFFWVVIGVDPTPRRLPHYALIPVHFAGMIMHAFFGVALLQAGTVLAEGWYAGLHRPWSTNLLGDQFLGAGITWSFGEIPSAVVLAALVLQWIRADEREQRRVDRAADRVEARRKAREQRTGEQPEELDAEDALGRYNAMLRRLSESDR
jgi:cytochrome c oxidase assembly factor CtaG/putative copper export protein